MIRKFIATILKHGATTTANVISYREAPNSHEIGKALNFAPNITMTVFPSVYEGDFRTRSSSNRRSSRLVAENHPRMPAFIRLYRAIYGLPRHLGQHSGGMIICQNKLSSFVPLENALMPGVSLPNGTRTIARSRHRGGFVRPGMMSVMQDAFELCRERGRPLDLAHIPTKDKKTFKIMQRPTRSAYSKSKPRAPVACCRG
jgi:error-prone DNA polymerase